LITEGKPTSDIKCFPLDDFWLIIVWGIPGCRSRQFFVHKKRLNWRIRVFENLKRSFPPPANARASGRANAYPGLDQALSEQGINKSVASEFTDE
jgi:hypothetical protein